MTHSIMELKKILQRTAAVALALLVWQAAATYIGESILLASPLQVVKRLALLAKTSDFWLTILNTLKRIAYGFLLGLSVGSVLAFLGSRFSFIKTLLWPYMITIKSVPVASFIVVAIVVLSSSSRLSVFISFLMVLPIVYTNLISGIEDTDKKLLQMAEVYNLSKTKKLVYITLPQIKPYLLSASSVSIGLAWKSGVAAEVIATQNNTIGEELYLAKVHLETADLFAWTVAVVVCSILCEKLFVYILKWCFGRLERL